MAIYLSTQNVFFTKSKVVTLVAAVSWYETADDMQKLAYYSTTMESLFGA